MPQGIFITLEGTEGSGKSTLIRRLVESLRTHAPDRELVLTREPGGTPFAEKLRALVLHEEMDPWTELFLYQSARADHLARVIRPALERGAIVLCDRFTDSTLAYQGKARGLDWKSIRATNELATQGLKPHLTFHLDIDPATGLKRARELTRFEAEGVAFQKKVRAGFLKAKRENPRRWVTLHSGRLSPVELEARALAALLKLLAPPRRKTAPKKTERKARTR